VIFLGLFVMQNAFSYDYPLTVDISKVTFDYFLTIKVLKIQARKA
jgi:hypothetical protein